MGQVLKLFSMRWLSCCLSVFLLTSCAVEDRYSRNTQLPRVDGRVPINAQRAGAQRYAWEVWSSMRDLEGTELRHTTILKADQLFEEGNRAQALREYQKVKTSDLTPQEKDALAVRIASTQLALRQEKPALASVSSYFRSTGRTVDAADDHFSLVLGFGYAAIGNMDQSLAWLSRAKRVGARSATVSNAAHFGVTRIFQSLDTDRVEVVAEAWRADPFITGIMGQERRRRSFGGAIVALGSHNEALYEQTKVALTGPGIQGEQALLPADGSATAQVAGVTIGAILPLTGKFASLGTSVKNGIELALSTVTDSKIVPLYKDDTGSSAQAASLARELSSVNRSAFVLGPLLSDAAEAVAGIATEASSPVINFSKKENPGGGFGVFRLGATSSSQVSSLFNAIEAKLGLRKLAIVFPDDDAGRELARHFREGAQRRALTIVFDASYKRAEPDALIGLAAQIEQQQPEAVFFADNMSEATRFFSALKPAFRQSVIPLGPGSWDNEAQIGRSKNALEGAVFVSPFFVTSRKEIIVRFVEAYQARYKSRPDFLAAQGFDAATLALAALKKQMAEGVPFVQALTAIERYEGLTGTIQVQQSGEIDRNFEVVTLKGGVLQELQKRLEDNFVANSAGVVAQ